MSGTETAVLEPERIERMRANVLTEIARHDRAGAARRGRRRARLALGGVAAAAVVIVGIGLGGGLTGMGGADSGGDSSLAEGSLDAESDGAAAKTTPDMSQGSADQAEVPFTSTVITTGSMSVEVGDVDRAVTAIREFAETRGGRIDGENSVEGAAPHADLTVRVGAAAVGDLRSVLDGLGQVGSVNLDRADVAAQVADVQARIDSLKASIQRLRGIISESGTTGDLLDAESQLTQRQADLEGLQAQQRVLRDQTSLATIHVSISSTEAARSVEPGGFFGGLTRGWNSLIAATNATVTAAGVLVPWLLPLGALGALVLGTRRWRRRRL